MAGGVEDLVAGVGVGVVIVVILLVIVVVGVVVLIRSIRGVACRNIRLFLCNKIKMFENFNRFKRRCDCRPRRRIDSARL